MKDIKGIKNNDIELTDAQTPRAYNLFNTQEGSLTYAPLWGIDLDFFLDPAFKIQTSSFESYLLQKLAAWSFTLAAFTGEKETFRKLLNFVFSDEDDKTRIGG